MYSLRAQYERFPYPPISPLALPRRAQGKALSYEHGVSLTGAQAVANPRILIAGCGTLEPVLVAEYHPHATEIVAVDLSSRSVHQAKTRYWFAHVAPSRLSLVPRRRFGRVRFIAADLRDDQEWGSFDYVIASNVLHHVEDPAGFLIKLSSLLKPGGLFRMVTYPKASRIWMRRTGLFLRANGITPQTRGLKKRARQLIQTLPENDPLRLTFENQPETGTATGIVDAFLHVRENPLSPLEWARACKEANLVLLAETQNEASQSAFLDEIVPELKTLNRWVKLQILDDLLELCSNPVLWLQKGVSAKTSENLPEFKPTSIDPSLDLKSEFQANLKRIDCLVHASGLTVQDIFNRFKNEVGPRVSPKDDRTELPGLALTDYDFSELMRG